MYIERMRRGRSAGFTLLEVMVALLILSIALAALVQSASNATADAAHLRDKTFAHWVALNRATEYQLARPWPPVGERSGIESMAGRDWPWRVKVEKTEDDEVRRMVVEVRGDEEDANPLVSLTAFLGKAE